MRRVRRLTDSVRVRVTFLATVLVAVVLTVGALFLTRAVEHRLVTQRRLAASSAAATAATKVAAGVPMTEAIQLPIDQAGGVGVVDARTGKAVVPFEVPVQAQPGLRGQPVTVGLGSSSTYDAVFSAAPVSLSQGDFIIVGYAPLTEVRSSVRTLWTSLLFGIPLVVLAVALVAWFLAGRALRPVEMLRAEVEAISASTLQRRVPEPRSHDEVARLARTMNSMLARLQASRDHERQFLSDASHELRSPLASLRAQLDTGGWPDRVGGVRADAARLSHLVDDLMDLAKAEEAPAPTEEVDLEEVIAEEVLSIGATTTVDIDASTLPATRVLGDRPALARMVRNLLDNAARHATARVRVAVSDDGSTVEVIVDDDGPGVPEAQRQSIFERFARIDESRARVSGGVGLGLAVVRATARRHSGEVRCEPAPLGGARFVVTLPRPPGRDVDRAADVGS